MVSNKPRVVLNLLHRAIGLLSPSPSCLTAVHTMYLQVFMTWYFLTQLLVLFMTVYHYYKISCLFDVLYVGVHSGSGIWCCSKVPALYAYSWDISSLRPLARNRCGRIFLLCRNMVSHVWIFNSIFYFFFIIHFLYIFLNFFFINYLTYLPWFYFCCHG